MGFRDLRGLPKTGAVWDSMFASARVAFGLLSR